MDKKFFVDFTLALDELYKKVLDPLVESNFLSGEDKISQMGDRFVKIMLDRLPCGAARNEYTFLLFDYSNYGSPLPQLVIENFYSKWFEREVY
jgi:hypothetical protein